MSSVKNLQLTDREPNHTGSLLTLVEPRSHVLSLDSIYTGPKGDNQGPNQQHIVPGYGSSSKKSITLVHLLQLIVKSSFIPPPCHRRVRWPRVVFTMDRLLMWECMGSHHRGSNDESVKYQIPSSEATASWVAQRRWMPMRRSRRSTTIDHCTFSSRSIKVTEPFRLRYFSHGHHIFGGCVFWVDGEHTHYNILTLENKDMKINLSP